MNALIVDHDVRMPEVLDFQLSKLHFEVQKVSTPIAGASMARRFKPQLIIFRVDADPSEAVRQCNLYRSAADDPILIAMGPREIVDRDPRLRTSVDHIVVGSIKIASLLREIRKIAWRRKGVLVPVQAASISCGQFVVAPREGVIYVKGRSIPVSPHESDLMYCLARRSPEAVTRETLLNLVWGALPRGESDRRVEACVYLIRRKIEPDPARPVYLILRRGLGYVLNCVEHQSGDLIQPAAMIVQQPEPAFLG